MWLNCSYRFLRVRGMYPLDIWILLFFFLFSSLHFPTVKFSTWLRTLKKHQSVPTKVCWFKLNLIQTQTASLKQVNVLFLIELNHVWCRCRVWSLWNATYSNKCCFPIRDPNTNMGQFLQAYGWRIVINYPRTAHMNHTHLYAFACGEEHAIPYNRK